VFVDFIPLEGVPNIGRFFWSWMMLLLFEVTDLDDLELGALEISLRLWAAEGMWKLYRGS
jgi:hypothetical protein